MGWSQNLAYNNSTLNPSSRSIGLLENKHEGLSGIVVGAGPSLDKNIHLLHDLPDGVVVISTDGACQSLLKAGIVPDYVASAEEDPIIEKFLKDVSWPSTTLLASATNHPVFTKAWVLMGGDIFFYNNRGERLKERFSKRFKMMFDMTIPVIDSEVPNISFHSIHLLRFLGVLNIALIGVDLEVVDPEKHHAGGFPSDARSKIWRSEAQMIQKMRKGFARDVEMAFNMDPAGITNCTEGGALTPFPRQTLFRFLEDHKNGTVYRGRGCDGNSSCGEDRDCQIDSSSISEAGGN